MSSPAAASRQPAVQRTVRDCRGASSARIAGHRSGWRRYFARKRRRQLVEALVGRSMLAHKLSAFLSSWRARCSCALQVPRRCPVIVAISSCV